MALLRIAALGALGYVGYKYYERSKAGKDEAFDRQRGGETNFSQVRDAGPSAMADKPAREWTRADEESDESFPASDPPANY